MKILRSALLHAEGIQHRGGAAELNDPALLTNRQGSQKDGDEPVLAPWQSVRGVPGHLKQEMSISPFVQQLPRLRTFYGQSAEDEWARRKAQILIRLLTFQTDARDGISPPKFLF